MPMRCLIAALLLAGCLWPTRTAAAQPQIARLAARNGWLADYQRGLAEAKRTGKPIFLMFRCQP